MRIIPFRTALGLFAAAFAASAQSNLPIYTDSLVSGYQDWSWASRNYSSTSPVHSGNNAIAVTITGPWQALWLQHPASFPSGLYTGVTFWANGGPTGGQKLQIHGVLGTTAQTGQSMGTLQANTWQQFTFSFSVLGVSNKKNFNGIQIQDNIGAAQPTFYIDDVQYVANPAPALTHITVNAAQTIRSSDSRWFGVNTAIWDSNFDTPTTSSLLSEMGTRLLRGPGGSLSDEYHWSTDRSGTNNFQWATSFPSLVHILTNAGADGIITVNYGTSMGNTRGGQAKEAAAWVAYANGDASLYGTTNDITLGADEEGNNWRTVGYWARLRTLTAASNPDNQYDFLAIGRAAPIKIKYWEVGNENYGTWETDYNTNSPYRKNEGWSYGMRASNYFTLMKMVDPTIKVGIVVTPDEDGYNNNYTSHPIVNPRTGVTHYGWTPQVLSVLKSSNITPDFAVYHFYPEYTGAENDPLLLGSPVNWSIDGANLRQQITDYFGPTGTNIELVCTENNSNAGAQGKQSTSLVNALYYADSLAQLMQTEFNAFIWWDLRNGADTTGSFDSSLYGWRTVGDLGMVSATSVRYPPFYAAKLMKSFTQPGDSIIGATSDSLRLPAYASRRANGGLSLLVVNKQGVSNYNAQISLSGFVPDANARVIGFGIPQDEAARTNGPAAARDIASTNFTGAAASFSYSFAPYSMTLFNFAPVGPQLAASAAAPDPNAAFVLHLDGQSGARYVIQKNSNLADPNGWTAVSTNMLSGSSLDVTNSIDAGAPIQFWRAVWEP